MTVKGYAKYLMVMAGLGGLLYGIDVGVIAAALPYIEKTSSYTSQQLSFVVSAVLLGSVLSSLFAGALAEWLGRKKVILISALCFTLSIPIICASVLFENGFMCLTLGRILQGASAGLVGVVVPMYLAECLDADSRGKGTGMFQLLLTIGLVFAAVIGLAVTGTLVYIFASGMPFCKYCIVVLTCMWVAFILIRPDYIIAKYNLLSQENCDTYYITHNLSSDAAPAVEHYADDDVKEEYLKRIYSDPKVCNMNLRTFNYSRWIAAGLVSKESGNLSP